MFKRSIMLIALLLCLLMASFACKKKEDAAVATRGMRVVEELPEPSQTVRLSASSTNPKYPLRHLLDKDTATAWVAGNQGSGYGEHVLFTFDAPQDVKSLHIIPGYDKSNDTWYNNNRLANVVFHFSDGTTQESVFDGEMRKYTIPINRKQLSWVKMLIMDTYAGNLYMDTCVSEVIFE